MVALRLLVAAVAALTVSCTSIFDSYYPDSLEFLESQTDLSQLVSGKTIVDVHMHVLQANTGYAHDVLAVIVDTNDGQETVAFYDSSMKKIKSYSQATLTTANGGTAPDLYPIMEDGIGFYTGQVSYLFSGGNLGAAGATSYDISSEVGYSLNQGQTLSQLQSAYYSSGSLHFPLLYGNGSSIFYNTGETDSVLGIGTSSTPAFGNLPTAAATLNPAPTFPSLIAATSWGGAFYVMFSSNSTIYVAKATTTVPDALSSGTIAIAKLNGSNGNADLSEGWVTARGGVVRTHNDGGTTLHAIDWTGADKGSMRVAGDSNSNNGVAYAFHPNGQYWFEYDPSNNRISKYKAWW